MSAAWRRHHHRTTAGSGAESYSARLNAHCHKCHKAPSLRIPPVIYPLNLLCRRRQKRLHQRIMVMLCPCLAVIICDLLPEFRIIHPAHIPAEELPAARKHVKISSQFILCHNSPPLCSAHTGSSNRLRTDRHNAGRCRNFSLTAGHTTAADF